MISGYGFHTQIFNAAHVHVGNMARAIRRTGWKLGCLTSLSCQIVTTHYDEVVASSRSQESPRSACAGVTSLIDPECFAASRRYWRLSGVFEQFVGVCPHHCRTGNPGPHTPEVQWGGRLTASASRCYPRRHELSSPIGILFQPNRAPPSTFGRQCHHQCTVGSRRTAPAQLADGASGGLGCGSLAQLTLPGLAPRSLLVQLRQRWLETTDSTRRNAFLNPLRHGYQHPPGLCPPEPQVAQADVLCSGTSAAAPSRYSARLWVDFGSKG